MLYQYQGVATYVVDGDTADVLVDLGFKISVKVRVRLHGINTPELHSKVETERVAAQAAKARLSSLILNKNVYLNSKELDKYGRSVGELFLMENLTKSVNQVMLDEGLAVVYMAD